MTELQIKAASQLEEARHNREVERLQHAQNAATQAHYERSDLTNEQHYQRSDKAGLISANANAMNAGTSRKKYEMEYDIEYGWTGSEGYPEGMPLSAQRKNVEIASAIQDYDINREKANAEVLNKTVGAYTSILNSVFGKGGIVSTVDSTNNQRR